MYPDVSNDRPRDIANCTNVGAIDLATVALVEDCEGFTTFFFFLFFLMSITYCSKILAYSLLAHMRNSGWIWFRAKWMVTMQ